MSYHRSTAAQPVAVVGPSSPYCRHQSRARLQFLLGFWVAGDPIGLRSSSAAHCCCTDPSQVSLPASSMATPFQPTVPNLVNHQSSPLAVAGPVEGALSPSFANHCRSTVKPASRQFHHSLFLLEVWFLTCRFVARCSLSVSAAVASPSSSLPHRSNTNSVQSSDHQPAISILVQSSRSSNSITNIISAS